MSHDRNVIIALERKFWDTMRNKDGAAAAAMTADGCVIAGAQGVSAIQAKMMSQMMAGGDWELLEYQFDDKTLQVQFPDDDTAVIGYSVHENLRVAGKPVNLDAHDTSVWQHRNSKWLCVLHTESVAGDPFGRDKTPAKHGER